MGPALLLLSSALIPAPAAAAAAPPPALASTLEVLAAHGPMNEALLGVNWEGVAFGWSYRNATCPKDCSLAGWVNRSDPLLSPKLVSALKALRVRSLRYPGGGPSNDWNWRNASFTPPSRCKAWQPCPESGYWAAQETANQLLGAHRRQLSWERFAALLDEIGARGVWSLDIVQQTAHEAADVLAQLQAALPHHQPLSVELGNEIYAPPLGDCAAGGAQPCMFPTAAVRAQLLPPHCAW